VGSTPTRPISFILVKYGIGLSSISVIVGQKPVSNTHEVQAKEWIERRRNDVK
jgi:hypothetical protein